MMPVVQFYHLIALAPQPSYIILIAVLPYLLEPEIFQIDDGHRLSVGVLGSRACCSRRRVGKVTAYGSTVPRSCGCADGLCPHSPYRYEAERHHQGLFHHL